MIELLQVKNLYFNYNNHQVLNDISFKIEKGQLCALFGPNGTGKTTLFKSIVKLCKHEKGDVLVENKDITGQKPEHIAKLIAYVPQDHKPPFPYLVKEVVLMGRTPHLGGVLGPAKRDIEVTVKAMEIINIVHIADKPYTSLSGGQRQLVLLARAFAQQTKILLLDEPTSNLDFKNQILIWRVIKKLTNNGITAMICTHDPNHVLWFCDTVIVLNKNGRIMTSGEPSKVLSNELLTELYGDICYVKNIDNLQMVIPKDSDNEDFRDGFYS